MIRVCMVHTCHYEVSLMQTDVGITKYERVEAK